MEYEDEKARLEREYDFFLIGIFLISGVMFILSVVSVQ